jgi:hypothetical protein
MLTKKGPLRLSFQASRKECQTAYGLPGQAWQAVPFYLSAFFKKTIAEAGRMRYITGD